MLFQQHKRRLYTWTSPDGQHRNQIDYILCSQRWRSSVQSTKTRPGLCFLSNHPFSLFYPYPPLMILPHSSMTKNRQINSHRPHHILKSVFLSVNKGGFPPSLKTNRYPYALDQGLFLPLLTLWKNSPITHKHALLKFNF